MLYLPGRQTHNLESLRRAWDARYQHQLPVAWDRERATRGAGLRTFPLVAVAYQRYEFALLMSIINFVTLRLVQRWKQHGNED